MQILCIKIKIYLPRNLDIYTKDWAPRAQIFLTIAYFECGTSLKTKCRIDDGITKIKSILTMIVATNKVRTNNNKYNDEPNCMYFPMPSEY